jgi:hypothetical protein
MARKTKPKALLYWIDVMEGDELLGCYAIDGSMLIVRSYKGWQKETGISGVGDDETLARMILLEAPPT